MHLAKTIDEEVTKTYVWFTFAQLTHRQIVSSSVSFTGTHFTRRALHVLHAYRMTPPDLLLVGRILTAHSGVLLFEPAFGAGAELIATKCESSGVDQAVEGDLRREVRGGFE